MLICALLLVAPLVARLLRRKPVEVEPVVSRNARVRVGRETGPMWEQDRPLPECFDEEDDW